MKHGVYMHQTHRQHNITVRDDTVSMCLGLSSPLMTEHEILSSENICDERSSGPGTRNQPVHWHITADTLCLIITARCYVHLWYLCCLSVACRVVSHLSALLLLDRQQEGHMACNNTKYLYYKTLMSAWPLFHHLSKVQKMQK